MATVIVPVLNEEHTITEVIDRLLSLHLKLQIIVINDGSTDGTASILSQYLGKILILTNTRPTGKGNAIRTALEKASAPVTVIQDADLEYRPEELPQVIQPILDQEADTVLGSRFQTGMPKGMAFPNKVVNKLLAWMVLILYGRKITDEATCYKAVRTEYLREMDLQCHRFEFCPEVISKSIRLGLRIKEVPISYEPRSVEAGKKIRWTDAPEAFWTLIRYRTWKRRRT